MKITQQELTDIIREAIRDIDDLSPEEEKRMDNIAEMIETEVMTKMDEVISMISNHLTDTMRDERDDIVVGRALEMLEELGFKELRPADAEKMIEGDEG